jgi:pyruvate dehydrogenase phosphatase
MYFRRIPVALVSSLLVGYGAWYSYNGTSPGSPAASVTARGYATTTDAAVEPTRTVLVVGADELRQGTIVGEGPISKETSSDGRKIVEMLTPEQATQKLRRLEQSFLVGRGQGVTRYDLVQLPSNDPIEDDHAEKIVQVPSRSKDARGDDSDWMFWGVFDGHSYVERPIAAWETKLTCLAAAGPPQLLSGRA